MYENNLENSVRKNGVFEGIDDIVDMEMFTVYELRMAKNRSERKGPLKRLLMWYEVKAHIPIIKRIELTTTLLASVLRER